MSKICLTDLFNDVVINSSDWHVHDVRIDIPVFGSGSDSINPHTQYSNPLIYANINGISSAGVSFTLGKGNDIVRDCINQILLKLNGLNIHQALLSDEGLAFTFSNISQLRWLGPGCGPVHMASSAILNTLLDFAAKSSRMPLWQLLSQSSTDSLCKWIDTRNYSHYLSEDNVRSVLESNSEVVPLRIKSVSDFELPAYYTTWIGSDTSSLADHILHVHKSKGFTNFKIKLSSDLAWSINRVRSLAEILPSHISVAADFNQILNFSQACEISHVLAEHNYLWIEEPFAPDNPSLHRKLKQYITDNDLRLPIATGENCPNAHVALEFICTDACDVFQIDACRVLSLSEYLPILIACKLYCKRLIPHAGGSCLDELVPHIQAFNLCRIDKDLPVSHSLIEQVGFCSHLLSLPAKIRNGRVSAPSTPGYFSGEFLDVPHDLPTTDGPKWLKL